MAKDDVIKFFSEYLPKNPAVKGQIDAISDVGEFHKTVNEQGKKAGFAFTPADLDDVMTATVGAITKGAPGLIELSPIAKKSVLSKGGELSEKALDGVSGGAVRTSTYMCPW
jgi:hypothetical protein